MLRANYILKFSLIFIFLILIQLAILNRISFFNLATPIVYIYIILKLPIAINRNLAMLIGFILGFTIDIFSNTPGINAAATTFIAFIQRPVQSLYFVVDDFEEQIPRLSSQKSGFVKTTITLVFFHHLILMAIESFGLDNYKLVLIRVVFSTILTSILIFAFESFSVNKEQS